MNADQLQQFRDHAMAAIKKIPGARWYAADQTAIDALAYLGIAFVDERAKNGQRFDLAEFERIVGEVVALEPSLRQQRSGEPKPTPKPWLNPLTNQPLPPPKGLDERGVLADRDPELLALVEALAKHPYRTLAALEDAVAAHSRIASINYGEAEHRTNPFLTTDLQAQGQLARQNPELAEFYKREARPVTLPWQPGQNNLTDIGRLAAKSPAIAKLANRAAELQRQVIAGQLEAAKATADSAQATIQKAEALLAK